MERNEQVLRFLQEQGIAYRLFEHEPKWTIDDCLSTPGLDAGRTTVPRNAFLCNRQQTAFFLMLLSPLQPFRTAVVSKLLGVSRLSFAPEEALSRLLGVSAGAVSPLGLLFDGEKQVRLAMDSALLAHESLWFHPCVNTQSVEIATKDFIGRFLPALGRECAFLDLTKEGET